MSIKPYCCKMVFQEFRQHFKKMTDEEIVLDIRQSCEALDDLTSNGSSWGDLCVMEATKQMEESSERNKKNIEARWKEQHKKPSLKPKRPPNVSPDGEVIEQKKPSKMIIPTQEEVNNFAAESFLNTNEAKKFFCYYDSNGWRVGKNPMKNWKSAFKGWCARATETPSRAQPKTFAQIDEEERQESYRKAQERINNYGK